MTCDTNGQCITYPATQSVGTVTVTGLTQTVEMKGTSSNQYFKSSLPSPVVEPGASVRLVASGGDISGFTLYGKGISPLVSSDTVWTVATGKDTTIHWEPDPDSGATVMITFGLDQHGTTPVQIVCEVEDTGSLTISADYIAKLIELGTSVPTQGTMERHTVDSVETSKGCIEFSVYSRISAKVQFGSGT
jgi:hypothetical protein